MHFGDRSDEELIELARAGWAPAFAVLVHRHAPLVHAAVADRPDPQAAMAEVFTRAMRQLDQRDASAAVSPWLLELAGETAPGAPRPLPPEQLDSLWTTLHERWPDGRRHIDRQPVRRAAALAAVVAIAAVVPAVFLGAGAAEDGEDLLELRAVPVPDERTAAVAEESVEEPPDFTFPERPEEEPPPPEPDPEPQVEPEPEPEPEPQEEPTRTAEPEPTEPVVEQEPGDDGVGDGEGDDEEDGLLDDIVGPDDRDDEPQDSAEPAEPDEAGEA